MVRDNDGAGNMADSVRGTAALITSEYPLALYLYCASHSLNLTVVESSYQCLQRDGCGRKGVQIL